MQEKYSPLVMTGWSDSPMAHEGHINDYLPGNRYGTDWDEALRNNDYISLYTVQDQNHIRYYKIVHTQHPESAVYLLWSFQSQDVPHCYDAIDRAAAERIVEDLQRQLDVPQN